MVVQHVAEPQTPGTTNMEPEALVTTTEPDMAETVHPAEELIKGTAQTAPEVEHKTFSAPNMEWDATR